MSGVAFDGLDGDLAKAIVRATTDTVLILNVMGRIVFIASGNVDVLGQPADHWVGRSAFDLIHPDDLVHVIPRVEAAIRGTAQTGSFVPVHLGTGQAPWLRAEAHGFTPISFEDAPGVLVSVRDHSGELATERAYAAARQTMDVGSESGGLIDNRVELVEEHLPRMFRGSGNDLGFLIVSVKAINYHQLVETFSAREVSRAMIGVGATLLAVCRDGDMVARASTDDFLIVCPDVRTVRNAGRLAERFRQSAIPTEGPILLELHVGFALGSVGDDYSELVEHAQTAARSSDM